ncbi:MAG: hypothetical protein WBE29_05625, partial [Pseudolabrys sp.]
MSAAQARRCRGAHLLNDLRVLIRRCRIKAAFNTSSDNGIELRVRHTLRNCGGGLDSLGISDATTRTNATGCVHAAVISAGLPKACRASQ